MNIAELDDKDLIKFAKLKSLTENELVGVYGNRLEELMENLKAGWDKAHELGKYIVETELTVKEMAAASEKRDVDSMKDKIAKIIKDYNFTLINKDRLEKLEIVEEKYESLQKGCNENETREKC